MKCKYSRPIKQDNTKTGPFTLILEVKGIYRDPLGLSQSELL